MSKLSELEYRAAREQWHLEMAISANSSEVSAAHMELARRYGDYGKTLPLDEYVRPD